VLDELSVYYDEFSGSSVRYDDAIQAVIWSNGYPVEFHNIFYDSSTDLETFAGDWSNLLIKHFSRTK
jgi:hypothetical protein